MSRLSEARERLAALRTTLRALTRQIIDGKLDDADEPERRLLGYREHELELVREIAELEHGDDGSASAPVPRTPRPVPLAGAGVAPILVGQVRLVLHLNHR